MFVFSEFCLSQRRFIAENLIVVSCLQFADCYIWSRILSCGVILCLNHSYGILFSEKFSFKKSWCCRKHGFVFEIVSLKGLNKFDQIIFFPVTFWENVFSSPWWKEFENFSVFGRWLFCSRKLKLRNLGRVTFESSLSKGLNVLAIFGYVVKKNRDI